jgi:hypothetical protein
MIARRQAKRGSYSLTDVRESGEPNVFIVTVLRDGRKVGEVRVQSTSPDLAYFNQPDLHPAQSAPDASKAYDFSI